MDQSAPSTALSDGSTLECVIDRDALRDWHRLFGLLLTDYFTGLPFTVEVERDLSEQQQFLDVVIVRRSEDNRRPLARRPGRSGGNTT